MYRYRSVQYITPSPSAHNKTPPQVQRAHGDEEEGTSKVHVLMLQWLRRRRRGCQVSESERPVRPHTARFQQVLTLSVGGSSTQLHWLAGEAARRYPTIGCDSAPFWIRVSGTSLRIGSRDFGKSPGLLCETPFLVKDAVSRSAKEKEVQMRIFERRI